MAKCGACGKFISVIDGVQCSKCCFVFHGSCINVPCGAAVNSNWLCPECKSKLPRDNRAGTPVRGLGDDYILRPIKETDKVKHTIDIDVEPLVEHSVESPPEHAIEFPVERKSTLRSKFLRDVVSGIIHQYVGGIYDL